jgi:hypothetical protein
MKKDPYEHERTINEGRDRPGLEFSDAPRGERGHSREASVRWHPPKSH